MFFIGKISVVIPCFNQARYLGEALESVLRQSVPPAEVIVVNDGSTDGTAGVARRYAGVDLLNQRNQGVSAARNAGLAASRGDYLIFLDADDALLPNAIQRGLRYLTQKPGASLAAGLAEKVDMRGEPMPGGTQPERAHGADAYSSLLQGNSIWTPGAAIFRRSAFERFGDFNTDPRLRCAEDYELYLRMARQSPIIFHDSYTVRYRIHPASASQRPERLLRAVYWVLMRERRHIAGRKDLEEAWRAGRELNLGYYGEKVVRRAVRLFRGGDYWKSGVALAKAARYCPAEVGRRVFRRPPSRREDPAAVPAGSGGERP